MNTQQSKKLSKNKREKSNEKIWICQETSEHVGDAMQMGKVSSSSFSYSKISLLSSFHFL